MHITCLFMQIRAISSNVCMTVHSSVRFKLEIYHHICYILIFCYDSIVLVGLDLLVVEVSISHSRHATLGRTPLDERSAHSRDNYLTAHNSLKRQASHETGGIRTRYSREQRTADQRFRPRGQRDQLLYILRTLSKGQYLHTPTHTHTHTHILQFSKVTKQMSVPCLPASRGFHGNYLKGCA